MKAFDYCKHEAPCLFALRSFQTIPDPVGSLFQESNICQTAFSARSDNKTKTSSDCRIWPPLEVRGAYPRIQKRNCYNIYRPNKRLKQAKRIVAKAISNARPRPPSGILNLPAPTSIRTNYIIPRYKSPELVGPKIKPHQPSDSSLPWPDWQDYPTQQLELRKPKSGIAIKGSVETTLADLISLGYDRPYAIDLIKKYGNFDYLSLGLGEDASPELIYNIIGNLGENYKGMENVDIEIEVETPSGDSSNSTPTPTPVETIPSKKRHKPYTTDVEYSTVDAPELLTKWAQTFRGESEPIEYRTADISFKRKTLQSHSFTNVRQTVVKEYRYGIQLGNYDQGDAHFHDRTRNKQTLGNLIVAYCFSFLKNPCQWNPQDIDDILELGNLLYSNSLDFIQQIGDNEVTAKNLLTNVEIRDKKFIYRITDPVISGLTKSEDKTVYNLTKGLSVFFKHHNCALLQTLGFKLIIWKIGFKISIRKRNFYYLFDPTARAKDLYPDPMGSAAIISFYDLKTIVSMLIERTVLGNWPFTLSNVCVIKMVDADLKYNDKAHPTQRYDNSSEYRILSDSKAVINASISLGDACFDWAANKQALPICIIALVCTKITPSAAWCSKLVDKIIILGNIFYCEIAIADNTDNVTLSNIPSTFTLGPYKVQIVILANIVKGLIFSKDEIFNLDSGIDKFFEYNKMGIIQFDTYTYAIWNQRGFYYMLDPYPRDYEGIHKWNGTGILSMHNSRESLKDTLRMNINKINNYIYTIHALKYVKICLGGNELRPKVEGALAKYKNIKTITQVKPVCIDPTTAAIETLSPDAVPSESNISICSSVDSLDDIYIPPMKHDHMMPNFIPDRSLSNLSLGICNLNSPTLSTAQLEPLRPTTGIGDNYSSISDDVYSMSTLFDLLVPPEEQAFSGDLYIEMLDIEKKMLDELEIWCEEENFVDLEETEVELEVDMPKTLSAATMTHRLKLFKKRVMHPPPLPYKTTCREYRPIQEAEQPKIVQITLSKELQKETNFIPMPDGSEIITGTDSITNYIHKNISLLAPFIAIMAVVVSHKYSITSWDKSILNYIISCGNSLHDTCTSRFDETAVYEFRRISLGSTDFSAKSTYVLDSVCKPKIMEQIVITLFKRCKDAIIVTPNYSCAIFYKNGLYYLFDPYNANSVGLVQSYNSKGSCYFARFTNCHQMVARILHNKFKCEVGVDYETTKFVLCVVEVHYKAKGDKDAIEEPPEILDCIKKRREECDSVQERRSYYTFYYQYDQTLPGYAIIGTDFLKFKKVERNHIKECHFASLSALLLILYHPIYSWSVEIVNKAVKLGRKIFQYAKNRDFTERRLVNNLFIENQFLDLIIIRLQPPLTIGTTDVSNLLNHYLRKRRYLLLQFPFKCLALYNASFDVPIYHLFDPYKYKNLNARWMMFEPHEVVQYLLKRECDIRYCQFYSFNITSIRNNKKKITLENILIKCRRKKSVCRDKMHLDRPFYEKENWLDVDPIPWNRFEIVNHVGKMRGSTVAMWKEWDIEFPNDLWSLWGNLHQKSSYFNPQTRGKQTLCNCMVCIVVTSIYDFEEWNPILMDSILKAGNQYYVKCVREMSPRDKNNEFNMEHLKTEVQVPPFIASVAYKAVVDGTMYTVQPFQFNLFKALAYFFDKKDSRCGIIIITLEKRTRIVAFGKTKTKEYFMYDCESYGPPLFLEKQGCSYILKTNSFPRLLFVIALTLREGDFYIYEVIVTNLQS